MRDKNKTTSFKDIIDVFYSLVTDDMYLEWSKEETATDITNILVAALPQFEFPRFNVFDYTEVAVDDDEDYGYFNSVLTPEEINILARLMYIEWLNRQILNTDVVRQKYSSKDFSLTSQASHLKTLLSAKTNYENKCKSLQRLYKRRTITENGAIPNYDGLGGR